jgi:predicted transcriptional regulator
MRMMQIKEKNDPFVGNLRKIMEKKGIDAHILSDISHIPVDDLQKILYNKKVAGPKEMVLLAKALHTDMNSLFEGCDDE